jgi:hypothetical protein
MSRRKDGEKLGPPRSCDPDVGFSQAPEHVEEDCLKYFLFNLKKRNTKGKIHSFKKKLIYG